MTDPIDWETPLADLRATRGRNASSMCFDETLLSQQIEAGLIAAANAYNAAGIVIVTATDRSAIERAQRQYEIDLATYNKSVSDRIATIRYGDRVSRAAASIVGYVPSPAWSQLPADDDHRQQIIQRLFTLEQSGLIVAGTWAADAVPRAQLLLGRAPPVAPIPPASTTQTVQVLSAGQQTAYNALLAAVQKANDWVVAATT